MKKYLIALGMICFSTICADASALEGIDISSRSSSFGTVPSNAVRLPVLYINLRPETDRVLYDLTIQKMGLSDNEQFGNIWAETSNYRRTLRRSLLNDDVVVLEFRNGLPLPAMKTTQMTVFVNMNDARSGNTFQFVIEDMSFDDAPAFPVFKRRSKPRIQCINRKCRRISY